MFIYDKAHSYIQEELEKYKQKDYAPRIDFPTFFTSFIACMVILILTYNVPKLSYRRLFSKTDPSLTFYSSMTLILGKALKYRPLKVTLPRDDMGQKIFV